MLLTRRRALKTFAAGIMGGGAGLVAHGYVYERLDMHVVETVLPVAGLAPSHAGLKVGFITDLHHSAHLSEQDVRRAADLVLGYKPDLIVLGGDYVTLSDRHYMEPCVEALGHLTAPHGVYAILGNHDDDRWMPAALSARGFAVLKDARTTLTIAGERLSLVGIRFWTRRVETIAPLLKGSPDTPAILLAHDPRRLVEAALLAIPAVLSGHTHGGQLVLPGIGPLGGRRFPVIAGHGEREGSRIFVSRGIGTVIVPVRVNCPPEVAIVTLTPALPLDGGLRARESLQGDA